MPELPKQDQGTDAVRDYGCDCHPVYCHVQDNDKEKVQHNIQAAGKGQGKQGRFCLADAAEYGSLKIIEQDDWHPQKVNPQIEKCQRENIVRHLQQFQNRRGC